MTMKRNTFGIGIYKPTKEVNIGTLTRSAYIFDADFFFTVGVSITHSMMSADTTRSVRHMPIFNFETFEEAQRVLWQYTFVAVEQGGSSLAMFTHPKQAAYLLGSEVTGLPPELVAGSDLAVEIETARPISLNVATTGSIVIYDRLAKQAR